MFGLIVVTVLLLLGLAMLGLGMKIYEEAAACYENLSIGIGIVGIILAIICGVMLIALPCQRYGDYCSIEEFKAFKSTIEDMQGKDFENATLTQEIAKQNAWLGKTQWKNDHFFDYWNVDDVKDLTPIRLVKKDQLVTSAIPTSLLKD